MAMIDRCNSATWSTTMARGMPRAIVPIGGGYGSTTTVQV
jgi:hypothetical protein